jgi:hypothetical protein
MNRKGHAIALTLVMTAALCADRVAVAAPQLRPQRVSVAARVMQRLTVSLCRVVPLARVIETRQSQASAIPLARAHKSGPILRPPLSPFEFRLPPPAV